MPQLFVPILVNDEIGEARHKSLFSVTGKTMENNSGSNSVINEYDKSYSKFISVLDKKLKNCFPNESFSFNVYEYGKNPIDGVFEDFTENTMSISLGILCSAYVIKEEHKLKEKYDSITVTGNFNVIDGRIFLSEVTDIEEKYKAVQDYAIKNVDKKHLFIYVSSEEDISGGWHNNIFVMPLSQREKIECVFAEVFEPSDIQNQCIQSLQQYKKEYIETAPFIKWKKKLAQSNCNGILLHGASNSGKTIAATNLCKYMIATTTVEEIIWITISDNGAFWEKMHKGLFPNFSEIIKEEFSDQFNMLDTLLRENQKCCLIVDNIEGDFTDRILLFIKDNYESALDKKLLKIVITACENAENRSVLQDLQLQEKNCETLMVHTDLKYIVYNAFENKGIEPLALKDFKENQNKLLELFSKICSEGEKLFPGEVSNHIDSIAEIGIDSFIKRYTQDDFKRLTKKNRLLRINFEVLDPMSQWVLFAFLGINKFKKEIDIQKICEIINAKIFNRVPESAFVSEQNIIDAVEKLNRKKWIHETNPNSKVFYVKADTINYCVFSDYEKDEIAKNLGLIRDILIPLDIRIKHAIQNDRFEIFEKLIKDFNDKEKINDLFIRCIECDRGINYLKVLDEKGIDPEYLDEDGNSAIDVVWCKNTDIEVLDYLLEKGFKPRKRIPIPEKDRDRLGFGEYISPLALVCDKGHVHLVKYVLDNHLYDDINDYIIKGLYTALQFYVLFGDSVEILDLFIKAKADISLKTREKGWSLLTCAFLNEKHPEVLEYILKNRFYNDIDEKDMNGQTALHRACSKNTKSLELLLKYGSDKDARDNRGKTILHHATQNEDSSVLQHILEHHYYNDINEIDCNGYTALHYAAVYNNISKSIELLMSHGADSSICTRKGNNILHIAASRGNKTLVEYILKHLPMVSRTQKNLDGKTPADLATSDDIKKLFEKF